MIVGDDESPPIRLHAGDSRFAYAYAYAHAHAITTS
jgi:hypothetical protein